MLDNNHSYSIFYQFSDSVIALEFQDELSVVVEEVSSPDTLSVSLDDSIAVSSPDTLSSSSDIPPVSLPGSSQNMVNESAEALIGEIDQVQDRYQQTDKKISGNFGISTEVETTLDFDISYYLNSPAKDAFSRDFIFPVSPEKNKAGYPGNMVFIENEQKGINNASQEFKEYLKSDIYEKSYEKAYSSISWIPALVILSVLLLTWIKVIYVQFLTPVLVSTFNFKDAAKLYNEKNAPAQNAFLILHIIFAINAGLFLLFVSDYFDFAAPDVGPLFLFLGNSVFIILLFGIRFFALTLIGFLFDNSKLFSEYKHNISLYNKIYGLLLLPIIIGLLYLDEFAYSKLIYAGLILGAAFYFLQLIRGLEIIIKKGFSVFYLILYLCAFEILPILVLYKLFLVLLI